MRDWTSSSLGNLALFQKGRKVEVSEHPRPGFAPYLGATVLAGGPIVEFANASAAVLATESDVLMLWDGERSGLVGTGKSGVVSSTVTRLSPKPIIESAFLYFLLDQHFDWIQARRTGTGVPHVPKDLSRILVLGHPTDLEEQRRIAEILSTVDEAIEQTEALISKTQQIKAGLMHDLFTRGVTADGQLRPPREEAPQLYKESPLGWIPREWTSCEFSTLLNGTPQNGLYKAMSDYGDAGVPIVRIDSFYDGVVISLNALRRLRLTPLELKTYGLTAGDILVNRVNSIDYVGKSAIAPEWHEPIVFESNIMRCRVNRNRVMPDFAIRWLCSGQAMAYFRSRAKSAVAQASINQQDVGCLPVSLPSMDEQQRVSALASAVETALDLEQANLEKLTRLKRGLLHDLPTGRVSVTVDASASTEVGAVAAHV